jgi:hypothetical protein
MRAINHGLTGAFIGLTVAEPAIAMPAALASHFLLDVIPHHGSQKPNPKILRSGLFKFTLAIDALLCAVLVLLLAGRHPIHWLQATICAFVAAAPDFVWAKKYLLANRYKAWRPSGFEKWASDIQWFQRPIGALVEVAWFAAALLLLVPFIR